MEVIVRDATGGDAVALAALLGEMGYPASDESAVGHIARFAEDQASRIQVAQSEDGALLGLVATHVVPRLDEDQFSCRVTDLVVASAHRRVGVGSRLLAAAEDEAQRRGARRLDLSSGEWRTEAYAFYASRGFEVRARAFTKRLAPRPR